MNAPKRKRLEAAGWRVGSTSEFLGLSAAESMLVEIKLALADAVRRRRAKLGVTQDQLARQLGSSQSRVAKMESADRTVSIDLLIQTMIRLGATRKELARVLSFKAAGGAAAQRSRGSSPPGSRGEQIAAGRRGPAAS
ncbi:MAG: helix-turn-helix domain-containing protein [Steroidobacteraceae bacterium]